MSKDNKGKTQAKRSVRDFGENLIERFHERQEAADKGARKSLKRAPAMSRTMKAFSVLKPNIVSMENLYLHLHVAMMLELATIPPYLSAIYTICLLYTSDAADDMQCVDLGGRRIIKKYKLSGAESWWLSEGRCFFKQKTAYEM